MLTFGLFRGGILQFGMQFRKTRTSVVSQCIAEINVDPFTEVLCKISVMKLHLFRHKQRGC